MAPATRSKGILDAGDCRKVRTEGERQKRPKSVGWSDLNPDLLADIFRRLDVFDYTRCLSVCAPWRSVPERTMNSCKPKKDGQLPWLLISSPDDKPCLRRFYATSLLHTKMAKYTMHLPQIASRSCIGSSQGFLITVDSSAKFCALNPLTGARFPRPHTHRYILIHSKRRPKARPRRIVPEYYEYHKAVISPSLDAIAVAAAGIAYYKGRSLYFVNLAFARVGDDSWTALATAVGPTGKLGDSPHDFIFHKGFIYLLYRTGSLVVFNLENPAAPPLVSPSMLGMARLADAFLTETPDGHDILLLLKYATTRRMTEMMVCRLDKNMLEWNRVQSIGDVALFIDGSYLSSLSTREFPHLKSNCVYFTNVRDWNDKTVNRKGVYDLKDGSIHPLCPDDEIGESWSPLVWFTPAL